MAFTQDEIQSLHTILGQKLTQQRQELEQFFDQRLQVLRREYEQRLITTQQEYLRVLTQKLAEQQQKNREGLNQRLEMLQASLGASMGREFGLRHQQQQHAMEADIERALAAQLLAIEQLISQRFSSVQAIADPTLFYSEEMHPDFGAIEIQTEIPWQEFFDMVGKALDERIDSLSTSLEVSLKSFEREVSLHLHGLHDELVHEHTPNYSGSITSMQDMLSSIEHLTQAIESLQVAMTANHALLSNRLSHHQSLPLERAHKSMAPQAYASSERTADVMQPPLAADH